MFDENPGKIDFSEVKWSQVKSSEVKWSQVKSSEVKWSQVKSSGVKSSQVKSSQVIKWSEVKWRVRLTGSISYIGLKFSEMPHYDFQQSVL